MDEKKVGSAKNNLNKMNREGILEIHILKPGQEKIWNEYILSKDTSTFYHLVEWKDLITRVFRHQPVYFVAWQDGEVRGVLPLFICRLLLGKSVLVSIPYTNFGGICADNVEVESRLVETVIEFAKNNGISKVLLKHKYKPILGLVSYEGYVTVEMPLDNNESLTWKRVGVKVRNQVRKARKNGATVVTGNKYLEEFYRVYARNTRDLGSPVYAMEYFQAILDSFPDQSEIMVVKHEGKIIGGIMLLWFRDIMCGPAASSLREYFSLCPNNLLYWETLRFAIGKKMKFFDFGRSTLDTGPYFFKKQWNGVTRQVYYQYWLEGKQSVQAVNVQDSRYKLVTSVWRRLPVNITTWLGPKVIKYIV